MNLYDINHIRNAFSFVYRTMVASVPLLSFAISLSDGILKEYYIKHLREESGHDLMLLDDLKRLGVDEVPMFHFAAQFAGSQYYLIAHDHPALLLGYMRALERDSLPLDEIDRLCAHHGTELTALRHHAIHDPQHAADLDAIIASLDAKLQERVLWNERNIRELLMNPRGDISGV